MSEREQIPRQSLAWLLISQAIILVPHSEHAPLWLWAGWLAVVSWRWQIFRGAWNFPSLPLRLALIALFAGGLIVSYGLRLDMSAMVGLLLVGFILKLLELRRHRDLLIAIYLGYFVAATQFLFHSGPLAGIYGLLSLCVLTATLLAAHQPLHRSRFWASLRDAGLILAQAVPLMLVLFLLVPRIGALWSVPTDETVATTGISDSMSPGDISELAQSNALAFRVTFDGEAPPPAQRYWRGLVFSEFDGRRWERSQFQQSAQMLNWRSDPEESWREAIEYRGGETRYDIILEPTQQPWLYSLTAPFDWNRDVGLGRELRLENRERVRQRLSYTVTSYQDYRYHADELPDWQRNQDLHLPSDSNPRTREQAQRWAEEAESEQAFIDRVLAHYRESFRYTLSPQRLGEHSVDEFMWDTQAGFCEHFAGSFAFAMRAGGIPARVVVGYLGATANPLEDYWTVRQRDAHAWAEVWLEGEGWIRIDPTGAVAPERIEQGLDLSVSPEDGELLERRFGADLPFFSQLQLRWDVFNYQWHRWVLGYDESLQDRLLGDWLGGRELWRIALAIAISGALLVLGILGWVLWTQRPRYPYPADRELARLSRKLGRLGYPRTRGESPGDYARRVAQDYPALEPELRRIAGLYDAINYGGNRSALADLRRAVAGLRIPRRNLPSQG